MRNLQNVSETDIFFERNQCHLQPKKVIYEGLLKNLALVSTGIWNSFNDLSRS